MLEIHKKWGWHGKKFQVTINFNYHTLLGLSYFIDFCNIFFPSVHSEVATTVKYTKSNQSEDTFQGQIQQIFWLDSPWFYPYL